MSLSKALPAAVTLLLAGCLTAYEKPTEDGPHAVIKYRRTYDPTDAQSLRESVREMLMIDDHVAYEATNHAGFTPMPRIDEVRVRAEPATFTSSVTFFHLAEQGRRTIEVPDATCSRAVRFLSANGATYLLELSFQDENACSLLCFEQVPGPSGELENRACAASAPPPPPALPAAHLEGH